MLIIKQIQKDWQVKAGGKRGKWLRFDWDKANDTEKAWCNTPSEMTSKSNGKFISYFEDEETSKFEVGNDLTGRYFVTLKPRGDGQFWYNLSKIKAPQNAQNSPVEALAQAHKLELAFQVVNVKLDKIIRHLSKEERLDRTSAGTSTDPFDEFGDAPDMDKEAMEAMAKDTDY